MSKSRRVLPLGPLLASYRTRFGGPDDPNPRAAAIRTARSNWMNEPFLDRSPPGDLAKQLLGFYRAVVPIPWHEDTIVRHGGMIRHGLNHLLRGQDATGVRIARCAVPGGAYHVPGLGPAFWSAAAKATRPRPVAALVAGTCLGPGPAWANPSATLAATSGRPGRPRLPRTTSILAGHCDLTASDLDSFLVAVAGLEGRELGPTVPPDDRLPDKIAQALRELRTRCPLKKRSAEHTAARTELEAALDEADTTGRLAETFRQVHTPDDLASILADDPTLIDFGMGAIAARTSSATPDPVPDVERGNPPRTRRARRRVRPRPRSARPVSAPVRGRGRATTEVPRPPVRGPSAARIARHTPRHRPAGGAGAGRAVRRLLLGHLPLPGRPGRPQPDRVDGGRARPLPLRRPRAAGRVVRGAGGPVRPAGPRRRVRLGAGDRPPAGPGADEHHPDRLRPRRAVRPGAVGDVRPQAARPAGGRTCSSSSDSTPPASRPGSDWAGGHATPADASARTSRNTASCCSRPCGQPGRSRRVHGARRSQRTGAGECARPPTCEPGPPGRNCRHSAGSPTTRACCGPTNSSARH